MRKLSPDGAELLVLGSREQLLQKFNRKILSKIGMQVVDKYFQSVKWINEKKLREV